MEIKTIFKDRTILKIIKLLFEERKTGRPGISLSQLSKKTGIERHRLAGMLEVLAVLGLIAFFQIGMSKVVTPTENLLRMKELLKHL
jgi:DNA-binding IclR family transcriptional regulator